MDELKLTKVIGFNEEEREVFATEVNKAAKQWPGEIAKQTRSMEFPFPGSVEKEKNFWHDMDKRLADTRDQLESPPVLLTKLLLKRTNRVSEQLIQESELQLNNALKITGISLSFLRDFPIEELDAANNLYPKLTKSVHNCLIHFSKLKHCNYDFNRAIKLLEVLGSLVQSKIITLMKEKNIMECHSDEIKQISESADQVFLAWKTNLATQRVAMKDIAKRRNEKSFVLRFDLDPLQKRINAIIEFREQHEKMLSVLSVVMNKQGPEGVSITELNDAFQLVLKHNADIFDTSPAGTAAWNSSMNMYENRMEKIEEHITRTLGELLGGAKSADEMFRIFSLFNPLFFRQTIKNAVNSFRSVLVKNVREDVKKLQEKFKLRYDESHERITADLRDIPPLSGRIIWAKQIENQLSTLMKRIQDVLGYGWEDQTEGKQLKEVCDELRSYLDVSQIYEEWLTNQLKTDYSKYNKVKDFLLLVEEDPRDMKKCLKVNFDNKLVIVFKEVKYLEWLLPSMSMAHKSIPNTIKSRTNEAYARYPVALALQSAIVGFSNAKSRINSSNSILLQLHVQTVREVVREAIGGSKKSKWIKWDSKELNDWVSHLSNKIFSLQERVDDVTEMLNQVDELLNELKSCPYDSESMLHIISSIQTIVDELPMKGLANIPVWVAQLDRKIESILRDRLHRSITAWVRAFTKKDKNSSVTIKEQAPTPAKAKEVSLADRLASLSVSDSAVKKEKVVKEIDDSILDIIEFQPTTYEIVIANQVLFLTPPLEDARVYWTNEFHNHISIACSLPRIQAARYQVFQKADVGPKDYGNILLMLNKDLLKQPYFVIANKLNAAKAYVESWLNFQALWDANVAIIADKLGRNGLLWQQLLNEMKNARSEVENTQENKAFGPILISNRQIQNKVNLKYDAWQKEAQIRFGMILLDDIKKMHKELVASKNRLESISLDGPTKDVISNVDFILKCKQAMEPHNALITELKTAEKLLQSQRFQFPSDWVPMSNVQSAYSDMNSILEKRTLLMEEQLPGLQQKLREEDSTISVKTDKFIESWNRNKPLSGNLTAKEVIASLESFTAEITKLDEENARIRAAKEALGLEFVSENPLSVVITEMNDLREAWTAVAPIHEKLAFFGTTLMKDVNPQKTRKDLDDLSLEVKNLPAKIRSYAAVEHTQEKIVRYLACQTIIRDLATDALKERHWKTLVQRLNINESHLHVTVGMIWECNPVNNKKIISEVLQTAQGEIALEEFLKGVREHWMNCEVELVLRDGVKVVIGWEEIFVVLEDNLSSLASLKQSPYFKNVPEFQEETANWESRLTNLRGIFDSWLEVQRKWVYLRGIFKNADLKAQLPAQFTKFKSIDQEYTVLMKRVASKPLVLELLQIDNLAKNLERQDSAMVHIQKALVEYLERQRQLFPVYILNFCIHYIYTLISDSILPIMMTWWKLLEIAMNLLKYFPI